MTITQTPCPDCGSAATPGEQCPECGRWLDESEGLRLDAGQEYTYELEGGNRVVVEVQDLWFGSPERRVHWGEVVDQLDADVSESSIRLGRAVLLEEWRERGGGDELDGPLKLPGLAPRVRRPMARGTVDGRAIRLYRNNAGISLEELVELAGGRLDLYQIVVLFDLLLEATAQVHEADLVHRTLSPRTCRVGAAGRPTGIPQQLRGQFEEPISSIASESTVAVEEGGQERSSVRPEADDTFDDDTGGRLAEETRDLDRDGTLGEEDTEPTRDQPGSFEWLRDLGFSLPEAGETRRRSDPERSAEHAAVIFEAMRGPWQVDSDPKETSPVDHFAAPEIYGRAQGGEGIEPDIFSLGMILYYLVAGHRPPSSVYTRHTPAVPVRHFRPDFPPGLGPVIKRATRPEPEMRYRSVEAFRTAFTDAVDVLMKRAFGPGDTELPLKSAVDCHIGIRKRNRNPVNQDAVWQGVSGDGEFGLMVVADGVSTATYGSGDIASDIVVETAERAWEPLIRAYGDEQSEVDPVTAVEGIMSEANERIVQYVNEQHAPFSGSAHEVMGTTALVALYQSGMITLGSVGDSRAYLQRGSGLEQLTIDHNLWTLAVLEGLSADDALSMPRGDALARCLGTFTVDEGHLEAIDPGGDIFQFRVDRGDTLLLSTDGLTDFAGGNVVASEENILSTLLSEPNPDLACLELILLANRGGGGDNIGVGVARFGD
jgi:protein phosphatase